MRAGPHPHSTAGDQSLFPMEQRKADLISNGCFMVIFSWIEESDEKRWGGRKKTSKPKTILTRLSMKRKTGEANAIKIPLGV